MTTENELGAGAAGNGSTQGRHSPSLSHELSAIQIKMPTANDARQLGSQPRPKTDSADSVEGLLHSLMGRLDENDRRYGTAIESMNSRLDELGERARSAGDSAPEQSAAALDRVCEQAKSLSDQISSAEKQHKAHRDTPHKDLARRISAVTDHFNATDTFFEDTNFDENPAPEVNDDFAEVTQHLENSLAAHAPANEFDSLANRMDDLSSRFNTVIDSSDNVQFLESIENQLKTLAGNFTDAHQQHERIESIESHLHKLMDWANSAEATAGKNSNDRFNAIEQAIKALNDNAREMDSRTAGTLEAMNATLQSLVNRIDEPAKADIPKKHSRSVAPPDDYPEVWVDTDEEPKPSSDALARRHTASDPNRMGATIPDYQPAPGHPEAIEPYADKRASNIKMPEPSEPDGERKNDFIAAAHRAAAAADAQQSPASPILGGQRRMPGNDVSSVSADSKRQRPLLVMAAVGLLLVSAGLLYSRLNTTMDSASGNDGAAHLPSSSLIAPSGTLPSGANDSATKPLEAKPEDGKKKHSGRMQLQNGIAPPTGQARPDTATTPAMPPVKRASLRTSATAASAKATQTLTKPNFNQPISTATLLARLTPATDADQMSGVSISIKDAASRAATPALVPSGNGNTSAAPMAQPKRVPPIARPARAAPSQNSTNSAPANETIPSANTTQSAMPPAIIGPQSLRMAAARGNPAAQVEVAARYAKGSGVKSNFKKAVEWFNRAAAQGYAPAQYQLAALYERGQGVKQDIGAAQTWYRRAAELGNVRAMHNLAVLYTRTHSNGPDYVTAKNWFSQGARYGLADSQFNLGILYESGLGTRKNAAEAYKWFTLAARQGDKGALKRRELIRTRLSANALSAVEQTLKSWKPIPAKQAANRSGPPKGGWNNALTENMSADSDPALIARAQFLLNKLGFDAGSPDGKMGPKTAAAIRKFEGQTRKAKTGKVTPALLRRLAVLSN